MTGFTDRTITRYAGADPEGVVWGGGAHTLVWGSMMLGLFLVFVKPIFLGLGGGGEHVSPRPPPWIRA